MTSASLAVSIIGQSLAQARGAAPASTPSRQVDRLLSNQGIVVWDNVRALGGGDRWPAEDDSLVAMDWTDSTRTDQTTLALNLSHQPNARADAFVVAELLKDELKDKHDYEDLVLCPVAEVLPGGRPVTSWPDAGFGDTKRFAYSTRWASPTSSGFRRKPFPLSRRRCETPPTRRPHGVGTGGQRAASADAEVTAGRAQGWGVVASSQGHERGLVSGRQQRRAPRAARS